MKSKLAIAVFIVLLVSGGLAGVKALQIGKLAANAKLFVQPPETVSATVVKEEKWQGTIAAIGSISAVQGVTVTPEIAGTVREIAFESGAVVAQDALLVRLDTSSEEAQLRAVEAQIELARINLTRTQNLRASEMVAQAELDTAQATLKQYLANGDAIRAIIAKKTIRAPFAGQLGIRLVNLGQYLDTGKPIVSLQSLSPVYADFSLPQQELVRLKTGMRVRLASDAAPGRTFEGTLTALNPDLDASTRSVRLQATLENPDRVLRPGMYVRVEVLLPEEELLMVIPGTAVLSAPYGDTVYVIEPAPASTNSAAGLVVRQQIVRTGRGRGDFLSVEKGLKPGDRIVAAGIFKLRNGMSVVENNTLAPKNEAQPQPADN